MESIKKKYKVEPIPKEQTKEWLLYKHYAKRVPPIMEAFGLYDENKTLQGVCTFAMPCVQMNGGKCIFNEYRVRTLELNRLVVNDGLEKNTLSFFVSKCINFLPKPLCLVSFADPNNGHHGYIYQATNWLYTGLSEKGGKNKNYRMGDRNFHGKTVTEAWVRQMFGKYDITKSLDENCEMNGIEVEDFGLKHRYIKFLGDEQEVLRMKNDTVYRIQPYPKGENRRYDSSYEPITTNTLF